MTVLTGQFRGVLFPKLPGQRPETAPNCPVGYLTEAVAMPCIGVSRVTGPVGETGSVERGARLSW